VKTIDYAEAVRIHLEKFGVEPVVTGSMFFDPDSAVIRIMDAVSSGKPYVEDTVKSGELI
jgi:hypothetical protein